MKEVLWRQDQQSIVDMPGALRTAACVGGHLTTTLTPESALKLARVIEDGLHLKSAPAPIPERVVIVERDAPLGGLAYGLLAFSCAMWTASAVVPAAKFIAGLF